jgi:hypothetical protein
MYLSGVGKHVLKLTSTTNTPLGVGLDLAFDNLGRILRLYLPVAAVASKKTPSSFSRDPQVVKPDKLEACPRSSVDRARAF